MSRGRNNNDKESSSSDSTQDVANSDALENFTVKGTFNLSHGDEELYKELEQATSRSGAVQKNKSRQTEAGAGKKGVKRKITGKGNLQEASQKNMDNWITTQTAEENWELTALKSLGLSDAEIVILPIKERQSMVKAYMESMGGKSEAQTDLSNVSEFAEASNSVALTAQETDVDIEHHGDSMGSKVSRQSMDKGSVGINRTVTTSVTFVSLASNLSSAVARPSGKSATESKTCGEGSYALDSNATFVRGRYSNNSNSKVRLNRDDDSRNVIDDDERNDDGSIGKVSDDVVDGSQDIFSDYDRPIENVLHIDNDSHNILATQNDLKVQKKNKIDVGTKHGRNLEHGTRSLIVCDKESSSRCNADGDDNSKTKSQIDTTCDNSFDLRLKTSYATYSRKTRNPVVKLLPLNNVPLGPSTGSTCDSSDKNLRVTVCRTMESVSVVDSRNLTSSDSNRNNINSISSVRGGVQYDGSKDSCDKGIREDFITSDSRDFSSRHRLPVALNSSDSAFPPSSFFNNSNKMLEQRNRDLRPRADTRKPINSSGVGRGNPGSSGRGYVTDGRVRSGTDFHTSGSGSSRNNGTGYSSSGIVENKAKVTQPLKTRSSEANPPFRESSKLIGRRKPLYLFQAWGMPYGVNGLEKRRNPAFGGITVETLRALGYKNVLPPPPLEFSVNGSFDFAESFLGWPVKEKESQADESESSGSEEEGEDDDFEQADKSSSVRTAQTSENIKGGKALRPRITKGTRKTLPKILEGNEVAVFKYSRQESKASNGGGASRGKGSKSKVATSSKGVFSRIIGRVVGDKDTELDTSCDIDEYDETSENVEPAAKLSSRDMGRQHNEGTQGDVTDGQREILGHSGSTEGDQSRSVLQITDQSSGQGVMNMGRSASHSVDQSDFNSADVFPRDEPNKRTGLKRECKTIKKHNVFSFSDSDESNEDIASKPIKRSRRNLSVKIQDNQRTVSNMFQLDKSNKLESEMENSVSTQPPFLLKDSRNISNRRLPDCMTEDVATGVMVQQYGEQNRGLVQISEGLESNKAAAINSQPMAKRKTTSVAAQNRLSTRGKQCPVEMSLSCTSVTRDLSYQTQPGLNVSIPLHTLAQLSDTMPSSSSESCLAAGSVIGRSSDSNDSYTVHAPDVILIGSGSFSQCRSTAVKSTIDVSSSTITGRGESLGRPPLHTDSSTVMVSGDMEGGASTSQSDAEHLSPTAFKVHLRSRTNCHVQLPSIYHRGELGNTSISTVPSIQKNISNLGAFNRDVISSDIHTEVSDKEPSRRDRRDVSTVKDLGGVEQLSDDGGGGGGVTKECLVCGRPVDVIHYERHVNDCLDNANN